MIPNESLINDLLAWTGLSITQLTEKADDFLLTASKVFMNQSPQYLRMLSTFLFRYFFLYI